MDGQVLGGGVVVLVAVVLWLVYLLPSWMNRARYDAAERNALRLNRALRVLAETSETPEELRVELTARQAHAQQKAARKARAEVDRLRHERDELEADQRRVERERERAELDRHRREIAAERRELEQTAAAHPSGSLDARAVPAPSVAVPRSAARARRIVRFLSFMVLLVGLALAGWGAVLAVGATQSGALMLMTGGIVLIACAWAVLRRMAAVARRTETRRVAEPAAQAAVRRTASPPLVNAADRGWTPRSLPAPLVATSGTRAESIAAAREARDQLVSAAREEAARERAERLRPAPTPIDVARPAASDAAPSDGVADASVADPAVDRPYARMGYVDDAEVEDHMRQLLTRRAVG